jgi:hypothetical protein
LATLAEADITALAKAIEDQFADYAELVPDGSSIGVVVESIAPGVVEMLNLYASTAFGDGTALPASALAIVEVGVKARLLRNAYRVLDDAQKEWSDSYQAEFDGYLADLRAGRIALGDSTEDDVRRAPATASEPRQITDSETLADALSVRRQRDLW